jgi:thymidine kinase
LALIEKTEQTRSFMKSLGFPDLRIHQSINHFDFTKTNRRTLIIGPMGSGKTEFSARIYRDSQVAMKKSEKVRDVTTSGMVDRRNVFYIRSTIDDKRFEEYPSNAIAYRGGYVAPGNNIATIGDSFDLEGVLENNPTVGTWIIDEAEFFDERIAYVIAQHAKQRSLNFIFPMLILNFRKDLFNRTARLIMEESTDVFPSLPIANTPTASLILIIPIGSIQWREWNARRFTSTPSLLWVATGVRMTRKSQIMLHAVTITTTSPGRNTPL